MFQHLVRRARALARPLAAGIDRLGRGRALAERGVAVPLRVRMNLLPHEHEGPAVWRYLPEPPARPPRRRAPALGPVRPPRGQQLFGQRAIARGLATDERVKEARARQRQRGVRIGRALVEMRVLSDGDVARILSEQHRLPFLDLDATIVDPAIARLVPERVAQRHRLIPVNKVGRRLTVAVSDPLDVIGLDDVRVMTGLRVQPVVAPEGQVTRLLQGLYGAQFQLDHIFGEIEHLVAAQLLAPPVAQAPQHMGFESPIGKLANLILVQAVSSGASEVLLEPFEREFRVRYRIDGALRIEMTPPRPAGSHLVRRLKVWAGLTPGTVTRPCSGTLFLRIDGRGLDLGLHVQPTVHGELARITIKDAGRAPADLDALGLEPAARRRVEDALGTRGGLVVVSGPRRSGRSTTLLAITRASNFIARQLCSIVHHARFAMHGIHEIVCDPTDPAGLARAVDEAAQDGAEVLCVPDVPDAATAARLVDLIEAGTLVVARLSAPDAQAALERLRALPSRGRSLAAHLRLVCSQRLVRRICTECRVAWAAPAELLRRLGVEGSPAGARLFRARGCDRCDRHGYRGRIGAFAVVPISPANRAALARGRSAARAWQVAQDEGAGSLRADAVAKALAGLTTLEEVEALDRFEVARPAGDRPPADPFEALLAAREAPAAGTATLALAVMEQERVAHIFALGDGESSIGVRDETAGILPDVDVARFDAAGLVTPRHVRVIKDGPRYWVEVMLGSTGARLNGDELGPMRRVPLGPGDTISLAHSVTLRVILGPPVVAS